MLEEKLGVSAFELRELRHGDDALNAVYRLRVAAWATEVPCFARQREWRDEGDVSAFHWAFFHEDKPIAAARMSLHHDLDDVPDKECYANVARNGIGYPIASFNRLVVHPRWRGLELGTELDKIRMARARELGCLCAIAVTDSGPIRLRQLNRIGFRIAGEAPHYFDAGAPARTEHPLLVMICPIS